MVRQAHHEWINLKLSRVKWVAMVLIAIEIFINITLYLRTDVIPIRLVLATAVMAVARKIIIFDYKAIDPQYVYASGAVLLALGVTYWIVVKYHSEEDKTI